MKFWVSLLLIIGGTALGLWLTYVIGNSDLPLWVKFALLS